ncbi:Protein N-acetyltransferase, RimJ/RimL family [Desulfacinum hydrothermale DSM 13146]|uniref:Protein N-acetyltransferase, RimJ/RimL family n=1 Tax=Desulfacinum hydrothermale DSM 13146 TaxID=1121390 RepID=A0A1W1WYP4_9BACT|nr:GNAT family N-acetyltransferase [Desulfacinum hydrothermale]SMC16558.1 Protein N-acetyltransferase, RimJ/RimL family [Desulfacinum hydrothermale DSM 13146]
MFGSKEAQLKDGTRVTLRPMTMDDEAALFTFFQGMPDELLLYIRHNVRDPQVVHQWVQELDYNRVIPLLAWVGEEVVADVTLHRIPHGWKRHIGEVRTVVSPKYQNRGLATLMLNEMVELASEIGLEKLWAEIPLDSVGAVRAFRNAGFGCKAVIEGLVKDIHQRNVDILIMVCDVSAHYDPRWSHEPSEAGPQ